MKKEPEKKSSKLLPIVAAIVVLLIAAAAWFFMNQKDEPAPDTSFAFLKGDMKADGVLANENNENVNLRLNFPGEDGRGTSYVIEPSQTCEGTVAAKHGPGNTVVFEMSEMVLPERQQLSSVFSGVREGREVVHRHQQQRRVLAY